MEYDIALIQQTLFFKDLSAFEIKQIFDGCAFVQEFSPKEKIIEEGRVNDDLFFLPKGTVQVELELSPAQEQQLRTLTGPIVLGEISFLDKSPRSATIRPAENVSIYVISGRALDELLGEMPHTGHKIKHNIALSIAGTLRRMNELLSSEMNRNQQLSRKATAMGTRKYHQTIANLAYHIHLSA
jgi:CRP/FNR family transcriptional regulator, cyclic AMP receptor protein